MNFPCYRRGQQIACAVVPGPAVPFDGEHGEVMSAHDILLYNPGPNGVHVIAGDATTLADTTCAPLPAGAIWAYGKGGATHLATKAIGGAQNILVLLGEGA